MDKPRDLHITDLILRTGRNLEIRDEAEHADGVGKAVRGGNTPGLDILAILPSNILLL